MCDALFSRTRRVVRVTLSSAELGGDRAVVGIAVDVFSSHETKQRTRRHQVQHLQPNTPHAPVS